MSCVGETSSVAAKAGAGVDRQASVAARALAPTRGEAHGPGAPRGRFGVRLGTAAVFEIVDGLDSVAQESCADR